jgi:delta1-piperideine-2-carboxylate reductase
MSPKIVSGKDTSEQIESFLKKYNEIEGVRLPGERRHKNRQDVGPRQVNSDLVNTISNL